MSSGSKAQRLPAMLVALLFVAACAGTKMKVDAEPPPPSFAKPPADSGPLAEMATRVAVRHGPEHSGFALLDSSYDGLNWRLALIDSAVSSVDVLTYLWYGDNVGRLLLERAVLAAERGVTVRLVVDDLMTMGQEQLMVNLENHPNIELRLFNPWENRNVVARAGEMIAELERLNTRMHDKLVIADGRAAIVGGRNLGDHYFGLNSSYNFHDLDLLGFGPIAMQATRLFDSFFNSTLVESAANLSIAHDAEIAAEQRQRVEQSNRQAPELEAFPREPKDWSAELEAVEARLHAGTSEIIFDDVASESVTQSMLGSMFELFGRAEHELLITNAYLIPGEAGIEFLDGLDARGVDVRILTNSLASHDVPAVNSHYEPWRDDLLGAGVELYEFRSDAAVSSIIEVPPVTGEFVGLHTKAAVLDGRFAFIGSMNLDPRSANINTEMGAIIDSPGLASEMRQLMLRDMSSDNAWQVGQAEDGKLFWTNSDETVTRQPSRNFLQNVMNVILKVVPKSQF